MDNDKAGMKCTSSFSIVASAIVRTSSCTSKWKSCTEPPQEMINKSPQSNTNYKPCNKKERERERERENCFKKPTAAFFSYRAQFLGHLQMN